MSELSIADGFAEINENVGDMIKYVANEPSVGLHYIQQHVQNAVPNAIKLKNIVMEKSHELGRHTEDLEDSIAMTRLMKECGPPIFDEMIKDIKASLTIMLTRQPIRGPIQQRNLGSRAWAPVTWVRSSVSARNDRDNRGSYLSNVLKSSKEKAEWTELDPQPLDSENDRLTQVDVAEELPVSSQVEYLITGDIGLVTDGNSQPVSGSNGYEELKANNREAKVEEWLKGWDEQGEGHHELDSLRLRA